MKKRAISLILTACLLVFLFPTAAMAADASADGTAGAYYGTYTAIGDSICAGFTQPDYSYSEGFALSPEKSPALCYASLVGKALGSTVYNLGKCGCDTGELLDNLANDPVYAQYIEPSDLISLEIGSDDLVMAVADSILAAAGIQINHEQAMALVEPLLTGDIDGIVACVEAIEGITLSDEQIQAIRDALSAQALDQALQTAYTAFCANYPQVVDAIREINPTAELVILNYYNPYQYLNFNQEIVSSDILQLIQTYTDSMNDFTESFCQDDGLLYVDISDTVTNVVDPHPSTVGHAQIAARITGALLHTVTAAAQGGAVITPAGKTVVKYHGSATFTISCDSAYEVLVDGVSVDPTASYTFSDVTGNHSIRAVAPPGDPSQTPGTESPGDGTAYYETYSALGDSITAGYGLCDYRGDFSDPQDGYVALTAQTLGTVKHSNLGLLGCDSGDLLDILTNPANPRYTTFRSCLANSDLISVDIGSNDLTMTMLDVVLGLLGYQADDLTQDALCELIRPFLDGVSLDTANQALQDFLSREHLTPEQIAAIFSALQSANLDARFAAAYASFKENWDAVIQAIRQINPNAAIAALGYYHSNPNLRIEYGGSTYCLDMGEAYQKYYDLMNTYISQESGEAGSYVFVDTTGVELNSTVNALTMDPHPSKNGHAEIAARLVDALLSQISAYAGPGGSVAPQGTKTVAYGWTPAYTYTYAFTPDTDCHLQDVTVDGASVGAQASYTFCAVTGDHTITGSFASDSEQPPARTLTGITITKAPTTVSYLEGQSFNPAGMEVTAAYSDNTTAVVNGYTCEPSGQLTTSDTAVTVTYEGKTAAQAISVSARSTPTYTVQAGASDYTITASAGTGGTITPSGGVGVSKGSSKTFTISASQGYGISAVLVDGVSVGRVSSYTFKNLNASHSIRAVFSKQTALPYYLSGDGTPIFIGFATDASGTMRYIAPPGEKILFRENPKYFSDLENCWANSGIAFTAEREILTGSGGDLFSPDAGMTRAMFITVLGKLYERSYGAIPSAPGGAFTDTDRSADYGIYLNWAARNGIVTGIGGGLYAPERKLTRQELAAILYRFAKFLQAAPESAGDTSLGYLDSDQIAAWVTPAVLFNRNTGVLIGRSNGSFDPKGIATRAEIATALNRFIDKTVK